MRDVTRAQGEQRTMRRRLLLALCCVLFAMPALAQVSSYGDKQSGENAGVNCCI